MRTFNLIAGAAVIALAGAIGAGAAQATTWNWDTDVPDNSGASVSLGNTMTDTVNAGLNSTAEAFQITGSGTATAGAKSTTNLSTARLFNYSGTCCGLGVTDTAERNDGFGASAPNHTVGNEATATGAQVTDLVAFQLPTVTGNLWQITNLSVHEFNGGGGAFSNLSVLVGGNSSTTLASLSGLSITGLEAAGFHLLNFTQSSVNGSDGTLLSIGGTQADNNTTAENTASNNGTNNELQQFSGSMLIVAASLDDGGTSGTGNNKIDNFKIASITGNSVPTTKVPEPGTLAVFAAGLAGLAVLRRRKQRRSAA